MGAHDVIDALRRDHLRPATTAAPSSGSARPGATPSRRRRRCRTSACTCGPGSTTSPRSSASRRWRACAASRRPRWRCPTTPTSPTSSCARCATAATAGCWSRSTRSSSRTTARAPQRPHLPHRLVCRKLARRDAPASSRIVKTQGSDTKLVAQMQPYYEAQGPGPRRARPAQSVPPLVTQIADGENGGVMMNEFPSKYLEVVRECSRLGHAAAERHASTSSTCSRSASARATCRPSSRCIQQPHLGAHAARATGPSGWPTSSTSCGARTTASTWRAAAGPTTSPGCAATTNVLGPMERGERALPRAGARAPASPTGEPRYRNALFHLLASQTSCYRYWGEGELDRLRRELARRTDRHHRQRPLSTEARHVRHRLRARPQPAPARRQPRRPARPRASGRPRRSSGRWTASRARCGSTRTSGASIWRSRARCWRRSPTRASRSACTGSSTAARCCGTCRTPRTIEILGSAYYHPVLPLIPPADRDEQIAPLAGPRRAICSGATDFTGFWPPEMGFSMELIPTARRHGYE